MNNTQQLSRQTPKKAKDINLEELFLVFKRRIWVIGSVTLIAGLIGFFLNQATVVPLYHSSSRIIIGADEESRKTLQVIVRDSSILDIVIKKMKLEQTSDQLANQISVSSVDSSQVVSIGVIDTDPDMASKIADTVAEVFREEVPKIVGEDYIRILSKAKVNAVPINPKTNKMLIYGVIGGIVLGIGLGFFFETVDNRIRSRKEIEELLDVPVIGRIPKINKRSIRKATNKIEVVSKKKGETIDNKK